jgi:hypothetical protein
MTTSLPALAVVALLGAIALPNAARAADQDIQGRIRSEHYGQRSCGCCGCLHVTYDHHRELRSSYGTGFDPRNYDQTEPRYSFGKVRAYPQYWTDHSVFEPRY